MHPQTVSSLTRDGWYYIVHEKMLSQATNARISKSKVAIAVVIVVDIGHPKSRGNGM